MKRQNLMSLGFVITFVLAGGTARAGWTPPESSVTPPAVVSVAPFAAPDGNGANPFAGLVLGPDGALYGSTGYGGAGGVGTLFRLETNGTFTKLHDFNGTDGGNPKAALVVGPDGSLYGSTYSGGASYDGTLFRLETNGTFTKLHDFNQTDGAYPSAALVVGPDGALYGSTESGGATGNGTLFRVTTGGTFTKLHDFNGTDGAPLYAALVVGPDGALYGSTSFGGTNGYNGTLFRLATDGTFTKLHDFDYNDGSAPSAALVVGPDGSLYGSTESGGASGNGTLFRLTTGGTFTKLQDLNSTDGSDPEEALVVGPDGALYGSTSSGGAGYGTLFRLTTDDTFTKLHDFNGADGENPRALVVGPDSALYGSTVSGGTNGFNYSLGYGTLFRLTTGGTFAKLHDFNGTDGADPGPGALVVGPDGALYGSTQSGGAAGNGILFRLTTDGTFTKLHDFFTQTDDGYNPSALVVGPDGALYGSTQQGGAFGGAFGFGTLFRLTTDGTFTKLHDFNYTTDGANPFGTLVVGPDGALYGSAFGDSTGDGTLFRLTTDGTFTKLHEFNVVTDGDSLSGTLVVGPDGALYGSTEGGGDNGQGTLFRLTTSGVFTKLHDFNSTDGEYPGPLVVGPDGALYGSTLDGGASQNGRLFQITTNGTFTTLHDFNYTDGSYPIATLVVGLDGALYGSTASGGTTGNNGTLFRLATDGAFTKLHDFNGTDGREPDEALVVGPDGALYGSTFFGGANGDGTLFRLTTDGTFTKLHDFNFTDGARPTAALVVGPDGALYGSRAYGGATGNGTLFRVTTEGMFTKLHDFNGTDGAPLHAALVAGPDYALYASSEFGGPLGGGTLFKLVLDRAPVADAGATPALVISPNGTNATVVLDGSRSSDPDGDALQYTWYETGTASPLASGVVALSVLPVGTHSILLVVSDGKLSDTNAVTVEVITAADAVNRLADTVGSNVSLVQALAATLSAALASIDRSNPVSAINQLTAFQNQVQAQLEPLDPDLAASLIQDAQDIIDSLSGGGTNPGGQSHGRFTAVSRQANGHVQIQFTAVSGPIYIIEASSDLRSWEMIGVATTLANGQFEFEDTQAGRFGQRFYRVVQP